MLKAVIFDFDGVVADSEPLHYKALNMVFADFGVNVPKETHWAEYLGFNDLENIRAVSHDYNMGLNDEQIAELVRKKTAIFDKLARQETSIIAGAPEFINMLRENAVRLAICSGALLCDIEIMLNGSGVADAFEKIVAADHVSRSKPDPEGYLLALSQLNDGSGDEILPGECLVVEDSHWGLEAAAAAGMNRVAVTNTYSAERLASYAQKVVGRLDELTMADLRKLCNR